MTRDPYLIVDPNPRDFKYRLSWYLPEDDDIGATLGDHQYTEADLKAVDTSDVDCVIAYLAIAKMGDVERDFAGFYWESERAATAALRVVKAAIKAGTDRPLPDWATKALAAGWKAPKGWRP